MCPNEEDACGGCKGSCSTGVEGSGKMINPESSKASVVYLVSNPNANAKRSTNSNLRSPDMKLLCRKRAAWLSTLQLQACLRFPLNASSQCLRFNLHNYQLKQIAQGYFGRNLSGRVTVSAFTDRFFSCSLTDEAATSFS